MDPSDPWQRELDSITVIASMADTTKKCFG